jgi:hypothetical protein
MLGLGIHLPCLFLLKSGLAIAQPPRRWWIPWPALLSAGLLSGCSWFSWTKPQPSNEDLINQLLYSPSLPSKRFPRQPPNSSRADQQITRGQRPLPGNPNFLLTFERVQRCLLTSGIPQETYQPANPSNFDGRVGLDADGRPVASSPLLIVLHETVASEEETLNLFRTPHFDESAQASYHMIIPDDGRRVRIVADENRAFGAGNSAFGNYTIRLKPDSPGSINNIALHLSFVTPPDGRGEVPTHSGYTPSQYRSAAAQILLWQATYGIQLNQLTTHKAVDRSQTRTDPRSFDWGQFRSFHGQLAASCGLQAFTADRSKRSR